MRVCARELWGSKGDEYPLQDAGIVGILPLSAGSLFSQGPRRCARQAGAGVQG